MKRAAYHNLGCKVNSYELDVMKELLEKKGYETVPFDREADIYVINTCTVTNIADRKSLQMLHRAKKRSPGAVVIAVGCYVETDRDRVRTDPAIDLAIGNNRKGQIAELLEDFLRTREQGSAGPDGKAETDALFETDAEAEVSDFVLDSVLDSGFDTVPDKTLGGRTMADLAERPEYEDMQLTAPGHTRAYIKIQDGCNQFCTYCIIPFARGRIRSRRPEEICREIRALAAGGIREVVLTGIHISSYGLEWGVQGPVRFDPVRAGTHLLDLIRKISAIPGIERIRLGSLEPRIMTEDFVRGIAAVPGLCPHFHLSLQSGCDAVLKRMNRHYTAAEFLGYMERLRRHIDRPALTTDVIVGFPGESEEEFEQTRAFLEQADFYEIHVFKYSVRKGTIAARMKGQLTDAVKSARSDVLLEMTERQARAYRDGFTGCREELLLEEPVTIGGQTWFTGHTARYVRGAVLCDGRPGIQSGALVRGRFTGQRLEGDLRVLEIEDSVSKAK